MIIKDKVINFFFPKFSELDLFVVLYLLGMWMIVRWEVVWKVAGSLAEEIVAAGIVGGIAAGARLGIYVTVVLFASWLVVYHAISRKKMDKSEVVFLAPVFYLVMAILTLIALAGKSGGGNLFETVVLGMVLARAGGCLLILRFMKEKEQVYLWRVDYSQMRLWLVGGISIVVPLTQVWFLRGSDWLPAMLQTYYLTTLLAYPLMEKAGNQ